MDLLTQNLPLIFLMIGYGAIAYNLLCILRSLGARKWKKIRGKITTSNILEDCDSDGCTYEAIIRYSYDIKGKNYVSDKIAFGYFANSFKFLARSLTRRFRFGSTPIIYVSPKKPSLSVLVTGIRPFHLFNLAFFIVFTLIAYNFQN
jgi:uncharacterized protein DUF3592